MNDYETLTGATPRKASPAFRVMVFSLCALMSASVLHLTGLMEVEALNRKALLQMALVSAPVEEAVHAGPAVPVAFEGSMEKAIRQAREAQRMDRMMRVRGVRAADFAHVEGEFLEAGMASYYGSDFAGRRTANGEEFHPELMTAAHPSLPLGTIIRVTNSLNGRSVVLRVNDRGPFVDDRVLDVSRRAAEELRMKRAGVVPVEISVLQ